VEPMSKRRILLVEDESSISEPLSTALGREGFASTVAETVADGLERFRSDRPDLVLLDVMLPDGDGKDLLRQIRAESRTPVVMLTARGQETDKVVGLELGADDYVVKPFGSAELIARIRAVLRRSAAPETDAPAVIKVGDVEMNFHTHSVTRGGNALELTLKEFQLLRMLMEGAGRVVTRTDLIDEVWDPNWYGSTKTLDVHVSSLRKKLGDDPAEPRYIHTVRGVGFRFSSQEELDRSSDP
jgi:two-component system, OmpR family, response regulator RegX3